MLKKLLKLGVYFISSVGLAQSVDLYQAPLSRVEQFHFISKHKKIMPAASGSFQQDNALQAVNKTTKNAQLIQRYQQIYQGLPLIGAQVMITQEKKQQNSQVNGRLFDKVQLNTHPSISSQQAITVAKKSWFDFNPQSPVHELQSELQIRSGNNGPLKLVYLVSFRGITQDQKPAWPFFVIDAQSGELIDQWDNIKNYADGGPGGNEKVHKYWYNQGGLPSLDVVQNGLMCTMETSAVKLVNLNFVWDWDDRITTAFQYTCNSNQEDRINGAFSPINDAYYFGHLIVRMYQDWYGLNALQDDNGVPIQLVMRVHFGQGYDNAFWDGKYMSFGDGRDFYPLVSLDIAGHEVTHGFTEQHANLEYHDQSGALNESLSDMAGQAVRAYLLETDSQFYNTIYLEPNRLTWGIGETIVRDFSVKALRFMDIPSSDGSSADCLDKALAQSHGAYCAINYDDVVTYANIHIRNPQNRQNFIVHTASGVFNKAFYLLAMKLGVKKAYHMMVIANSTYWTPTTDFIQGACGVLYAGRDLLVNEELIQSVFNQVGIDTASCVYLRNS